MKRIHQKKILKNSEKVISIVCQIYEKHIIESSFSNVLPLSNRPQRQHPRRLGRPGQAAARDAAPARERVLRCATVRLGYRAGAAGGGVIVMDVNGAARARVSRPASAY